MSEVPRYGVEFRGTSTPQRVRRPVCVYVCVCVCGWVGLGLGVGGCGGWGHLNAAAGAESPDAAGLPRGGQSWQQLHLIGWDAFARVQDV